MVDLIINILGPPKKHLNGHRKLFKVISTMFIVVMVSQLYKCIQAHQIPGLTQCNSLHTDYTYLNKVKKILSNEQMEEKPPERMITQKSRENVPRNGRS